MFSCRKTKMYLVRVMAVKSKPMSFTESNPGISKSKRGLRVKSGSLGSSLILANRAANLELGELI